MKARKFVFSAVVILVAGLYSPVVGWTQDLGYEQLVTQAEFATGVVGAILGQDRSRIDDAEAMQAMKDKGLVPEEWTGEGNVTMVEAADTFHLLGFQVFVEESDDFLSSGVFEQILRHHIGEIKKTKHHWDIVHYFSMGLELGEYRERILGPSSDNPYGATEVVSPSEF